MKVLFNIFSTISFIGVVSIIGGGAYVYVNKDAIVDNIKQQVVEAATGAVVDALPGGTLPELENPTEGIAEAPATTGLPVPNPVVPF